MSAVILLNFIGDNIEWFHTKTICTPGDAIHDDLLRMEGHLFDPAFRLIMRHFHVLRSIYS